MVWMAKAQNRSRIVVPFPGLRALPFPRPAPHLPLPLPWPALENVLWHLWHEFRLN